MAWTCKAKDKDGKFIEAAPGQPLFFLRGPETKQELIAGVNLLLKNKRLDALRFGFDDPGYTLDESTIQHVPESVDPIDQFHAGKNLKPLNLPMDAAVNAAHDKLIAEHGG